MRIVSLKIDSWTLYVLVVKAVHEYIDSSIRGVEGFLLILNCFLDYMDEIEFIKKKPVQQKHTPNKTIVQSQN